MQKTTSTLPGASRIIPPAPPGWTSWESLMLLAMEEAEKAKTMGEIPVGAVIVNLQGQVIGTGYNQCITTHDPTAHAEIVALRKAGIRTGNYRIADAVLVVSLEPCLMCAGAMAHARIAGVVYGARDLKSGVVESCMDTFSEPFLNHHPWFLGGILEDQCQKQLQIFFSSRRVAPTGE